LLEDSLEARVGLGTSAPTPLEILDSVLEVSYEALLESSFVVGGAIVHDL
jgi:hypothetical protein